MRQDSLFSKTCPGCYELLAISQFSKDSSQDGSLQTYCKGCVEPSTNNSATLARHNKENNMLTDTATPLVTLHNVGNIEVRGSAKIVLCYPLCRAVQNICFDTSVKLTSIMAGLPMDTVSRIQQSGSFLKATDLYLDTTDMNQMLSKLIPFAMGILESAKTDSIRYLDKVGQRELSDWLKKHQEFQSVLDEALHTFR